jgi:hypothetical protein
MDVRVVLKQTVLHGSSQPEVLQKFAVAYIDRAEYRVYAPPEAKGEALDWLGHCSVRQFEGVNSEIETYGAPAALVLKAVHEELEKEKVANSILKNVSGAHRADGMHPDGVHSAAQICLKGHVQHYYCEAFDSKAYCTSCGSVCIDECPQCKEPIRGGRLDRSPQDYVRPQFCHRCGKPYPWMQNRLSTAKDLLWHADKLSPEDRNALWEDLQYVMADPKGDLAPAKRKLIDIRLDGAGQFIKEAVLELMAKTAAEMMKP